MSCYPYEVIKFIKYVIKQCDTKKKKKNTKQEINNNIKDRNNIKIKYKQNEYDHR